MQITLVQDSLAPPNFMFSFPNGLATVSPPSWMAAILQYGGNEQFFLFLNFLVYWFFNF